MAIPLRFLRACVDDLPRGRPRLSARELAQQERILATAEALMARFGRAALTFSSFATAIRMSPATIRRHFADLDCILTDILCRHVADISAAIGRVPFDTPNLHAARRAAYAEATRTPFSAPTERHLLFIRDRHLLPPDLADTVETLRDGLADMLTAPHEAAVLALLDTAELPLPHIEAMLAALHPVRAEQPAPAKSEAARPDFQRVRPPTRPLLAVPPYTAASFAQQQARAGP